VPDRDRQVGGYMGRWVDTDLHGDEDPRCIVVRYDTASYGRSCNSTVKVEVLFCTEDSGNQLASNQRIITDHPN
jgi:hypothetical protein